MEDHKIPVSFTHGGKEYHGALAPVYGGGVHVYHLEINNYYFGRLRFANDRWMFDTNKLSEGWEVLADYFGEIVIAWH